MLIAASAARSWSGTAAASSSSARSIGDPCRPRSHKSSSAALDRAGIASYPKPLRLDEARLLRFGHVVVALPAFVLELDALDGNGVRVRIEIGQRLVLRDAAAVDLVGNRQLACFVVDLDDDFLAEVLERDLGAEPRAVVPDLVRPLFERNVVGDAA